MGYDIGTLLECAITNVSNAAIEDGNWGGLIKLTYVTSAVQIVPIFFIYCKFKGAAEPGELHLGGSVRFHVPVHRQHRGVPFRVPVRHLLPRRVLGVALKTVVAAVKLVVGRHSLRFSTAAPTINLG